MKKLLFPVVTLFLFTACSTTVVDETERAKPVDAKPIEESKRSTLITADKSKSVVSFVGKKGGLMSHEGKFENFTFEMTLDQSAPTDLTKATIVSTIDVTSMVTDSDGLTKHLLASDFFDADTHSSATFISNSIEKQDDDYMVSGTLTIKGVSKDIKLLSEITDSYISFEYQLDRTQFGIGPKPEGVKAIDADVPVSATIVFQ